MSDIDQMQRNVGEWADRTFPTSTRESITEHLFDEAVELKSDPGDSAEAADMFLLLLHHAHKCGYSLAAAARAKHDRNTRRVWGTPDHRGVTRHVQEPPQ